MAVFQYKDLMISVGSNLQGLPGHCACYALSFKHTYQRAIAADILRVFCRPSAPQCYYSPHIEPYCIASYPPPYPSVLRRLRLGYKASGLAPKI
jgi:hypothetical protein